MTNWESFHYRNLWQHPLWKAFQESLGHKTWQLEIPGAMALVVQHALPFGLCWLEVPRGPLFQDDKALETILKEIQKLAQKEKAIFVRFSPYQELRVMNYELRNSVEDKHPQTSLVIDLAVSEEQILAQMKPKGRYNIKVAQKHNIVVEPSEDVESFHQILEQTGGRDGFFIHGKAYYQKMLDALGHKAQLLVAKLDGKVIAGGIFVYLDDGGIYYYGASDHHYRKQMAPYLIQWEAIKEAKKRGCKTYDFLGIAPEDSTNHTWAGVTDFKKKFGGHVVHYTQAKEMILRPFWFWIYKIRKRLR